MRVIAHASDALRNAEGQAAEGAQAVLEYLVAMDPRPDLLVATGDIADHGGEPGYEQAVAWLDRWPEGWRCAPATTTYVRPSSPLSTDGRQPRSNTAATGS
ncbi:hypothetical protein EV651_11245 [Kribbella sp. VKM Ac-2571]|uniref:hypothetical protein n=1 Tax=Kribbella sp. VKM Ac-2571 TaxID=2512222 RepID=UPI0010DA216E|nr:hypothetical protein [Kribbella sp. VKM Ac-2571]TDO56658.1 hypothetical protein EV651_11245 [Kribbella sp. VKM Ac-2571]